MNSSSFKAGICAFALLLCSNAASALEPSWMRSGDRAVRAGQPVDSSKRIALAVHPELSGKYLEKSFTATGKPHIVVGFYNEQEGLVAGYQSKTGKRLLFRATFRSNGLVFAEVAHLNPATGKVELLLGHVREGEKLQEGASIQYRFAGHDLGRYLSDRKSQGGSAAKDDIGRQFLQSDGGAAFAQGVPALFTALNDVEDDRLSVLQAAFGAVLGALQIASETYTGFEDPDAVVGARQAANLKGPCSGEACRYEGRYFIVHESGLFDTLSKRKGKPEKKRLGAANIAPPPSISQPLSAKLGFSKSLSCGDCFGMCGPGCFNPGEVWTPECNRHDSCVCQVGHLSCVNTVDIPPECDDCGSLGDAIGSYIDAIFGNRPISPDEPGFEEWWDDPCGMC